jgi:hypothetical protein
MEGMAGNRKPVNRRERETGRSGKGGYTNQKHSPRLPDSAVLNLKINKIEN